MKPTLLALDTSTEICSVAVNVGDSVHMLECHDTKLHSKIILSLIDDLLKQAQLQWSQLDALVFACGPGSFTGIRLSASLIQGLAFAIDKPIISISTLACLAQAAVTEFQAQRILATLDARMQEIYAGFYRLDAGLPLQCEQEIVISPKLIQLPDDKEWLGIGSGFKTYFDDITSATTKRIIHCYPYHYPQAKYLIPLAQQKFARGEFVEDVQALPIYLRDKVT